jgi:hypothetical protein
MKSIIAISILCNIGVLLMAWAELKIKDQEIERAAKMSMQLPGAEK